MISERRFESNPYLRMRGESQLRAKHAFERAAGWRFGFVFGALLVLFGYVPDAFQLWSWHAEYWWVKLALACFTILPLAVLAGGIAGHVNWQLKLPVWALFGMLAGWCAVNIPFNGARIMLQNLDSNLSAAPYLPVPLTASESYGMLAALGAGVGLVVGGLQTLLVAAAWEHSTEDYRMTAIGWAFLLLTAPFAFGFAFLYDWNTHLTLRLPVERVHAIVQSGLDDAPNQNPTTMASQHALNYVIGQHWRARFGEKYTIHLAGADSARPGESYVDASFDNGFNLRCRIALADEVPIACMDLNAEYTRLISEFVPRGSFRCGDCEASVSPQAAEWRAANARELDSAERVSIKHGAGGSVLVRVSAREGNRSQAKFECLVSGADPVIVEHCRNL